MHRAIDLLARRLRLRRLHDVARVQAALLGGLVLQIKVEVNQSAPNIESHRQPLAGKPGLQHSRTEAEQPAHATAAGHRTRANKAETAKERTSHHQRPSRSCWLGSTCRVHGSQPMDM